MPQKYWKVGAGRLSGYEAGNSARFRDDRRPATLGDVKASLRAVVILAPKRTIVIARSAP